jgi:protein SCO1/2
MNRRILWTGIAIAGVIGFLGAALLVADHLRPFQAAQDQAQGRADIGGPFTLTDHTGTPITEAALRDKVTLIYFGYSYCPDICPTDLQSIGETLDLLGSDLPDAQALFITVDPERDTVEHLAGYVSLFHPGIRGVTGTPEQIEAVKKAFRVYSKKVSAEEAGTTDYLVDHSAFIYLFDRRGHFVRVFGHGVQAAEMATAMKAVQ